MKRKKKSGPTTVTIQMFNEKGETVAEVPVPIHWYTGIQRMAQARSISFNEMMVEVLSVGADMLQAELDWRAVGEIRARRVIDRLKSSEDPKRKAEGLALEQYYEKAFGRKKRGAK